jgi:acyl CoA:acetate/3-ketoacid CoA transferase
LARRDQVINKSANLGIGIPTLVSNWIEGRDIVLEAEIGMLNTGPLAYGDDVDQDLINASCQPVCEMSGAAYFDIVESFAMIRGGHIDIAVMGALQVNAKGDYAGALAKMNALRAAGDNSYFVTLRAAWLRYLGGDYAGAEAGYRACRAARAGAVAQGSVGAGTGATVGKALGVERCLKGGLGTASVAM